MALGENLPGAGFEEPFEPNRSHFILETDHEDKFPWAEPGGGSHFFLVMSLQSLGRIF
jgi:hypothetical protein